MYLNNFLSLQKEVFLTEKQKLEDSYFHDMADFFISALVKNKTLIYSARNYYSSTRGELDFQYLEDIYGMQNPIDLTFTNIIKPRVDALIGLSLLTEPEFRVAYTDADTVKASKEEAMAKLLTELQTEIGRKLEQTRNDVEANPNGAQPAKSAGPNDGLKEFLDGLTASTEKTINPLTR